MEQSLVVFWKVFFHFTVFDLQMQKTRFLKKKGFSVIFFIELNCRQLRTGLAIYNTPNI